MNRYVVITDGSERAIEAQLNSFVGQGYRLHTFTVFVSDGAPWYTAVMEYVEASPQ